MTFMVERSCTVGTPGRADATTVADLGRCSRRLPSSPPSAPPVASSSNALAIAAAKECGACTAAPDEERSRISARDSGVEAPTLSCWDDGDAAAAAAGAAASASWAAAARKLHKHRQKQTNKHSEHQRLIRAAIGTSNRIVVSVQMSRARGFVCQLTHYSAMNSTGRSGRLSSTRLSASCTITIPAQRRRTSEISVSEWGQSDHSATRCCLSLLAVAHRPARGRRPRERHRGVARTSARPVSR